MADWSYKAYDLVTGSFLAELDVAEYVCEDELNGIGTFNGKISFGDDQSAIPEIRNATTPGKTFLVGLRNRRPVFGGPIWRRLYSADPGEVTFSGAGLMSHFMRFPIPVRLNYVDWDQTSIAGSLLNSCFQRYAGSRPGGTDFAWVITATGVERDRLYESWERKPYGEALMQLAAVENGFDWTMRPEIIDGEMKRRWRTWYPRRGRTFEESSLRWRTGSQVIMLQAPEDATQMASSVLTQGAGDGPSMLVGSAATTDLIDAGYPPYAATIPYRTVTKKKTLTEHAKRDLARLGRADWDEFQVDVDPDFEDMPWGSWDLGDDVQLVVEEDPWYDTGSYLRRITKHTWNVTSRTERLTARLEVRDLQI